MSCVKSVKGVYFLRFLLGLAEAGFYPGVGIRNTNNTADYTNTTCE
jgi:hypothetical protein